MKMQLIIGNKKYSSWSFRPWLAMKVLGVEFEEVLSTFDMSTTSAHFIEHSPSKKVPVLKHGELTVWDSLAMLEYLAETYPSKNWWPKDASQRATARALAHEMHGGFSAVRDECPMNFGRTPARVNLSERCQWEFSRLEDMWTEALKNSALGNNNGPFLFGEFGIVDAMYAPIVSRIASYEIDKGPAMLQYCKTIEALPDYQDWAEAGRAETEIVKQVEI